MVRLTIITKNVQNNMSQFIFGLKLQSPISLAPMEPSTTITANNNNNNECRFSTEHDGELWNVVIFITFLKYVFGTLKRCLFVVFGLSKGNDKITTSTFSIGLFLYFAI